MRKEYALVTGGSSGIGFQYARVLASMGYRIIIVSNEEQALAKKSKSVEDEFSVEVLSLYMDLGKQESARETYLWCTRNNLEVEVLINNAGVYHDRDFLKDSEGFNQLILNLHVFTPSMLAYYFGQDMAKRHKGYILNMSSVTSEIAVQRLATYSATKAYLKNFSRCIHVEMRGEGIHVTCVRPGAVATDLYNLKPGAVKTGLILGYIITPERLAQKGVKALMKGRARVTPGLSSKILIVLVSLIPTCVLRLVRKLGIF